MSKPPPITPAMRLYSLSPLERHMLHTLSRGPRKVPLGFWGDFRRLAIHSLARRGGCTVHVEWESGRVIAEITEHGRQRLAEMLAETRTYIAA